MQKEHEVNWDQETEDAIDRYISSLVVIANLWFEKSVLCGCLNCRRKADAKEKDKNDAIYWAFADYDEYEEDIEI